jgi:hypothetical protein
MGTMTVMQRWAPSHFYAKWVPNHFYERWVLNQTKSEHNTDNEKVDTL